MTQLQRPTLCLNYLWTTGQKVIDTTAPFRRISKADWTENQKERERHEGQVSLEQTPSLCWGKKQADLLLESSEMREPLQRVVPIADRRG